VFIDGVLALLFNTLRNRRLLLSSALTNQKYKTVIDTYFNQIANKEGEFNSLNTAFANEGHQYPKKSKVADKPIEIMYFSTGTEAALMVQPRNLVL
jgi:Fe-S cluster assembly protein SufD